MSTSRGEVEKFDGHGDYILWKDRLLAHIDLLGLSRALDESDKITATPSGKETAEKAEKDETFEEKKKKARSAIVLCITERVQRKVRKEVTAAAMLRALDRLYLAKALPNRIYLKQKLYGFKMSESATIEKNIDDFLQMVDELENAGASVSDEDQAILLLMSLPRQFDHLRDTLRYSNRETLTLDDVVAAINSKELDFGSNPKGSKSQAEGLYVKEKGDQRGRGERKEKHSKQQRSRSKSKNRKACWICEEEGHFKNSCPNRNKLQGKAKDAGSSRGEAAMVTANRSDSTGLYVSEALHLTDISLEDVWVMDTGCSYHMTYKKEWFEDLKEDVGGSVRMGNKTTSKVKGIGNVKIRNEDGSTVVLTHVRYIPDMDRNLLSIGTMEEQG